MTRIFATRGLAFWLTISLMVHLPLCAVIIPFGEEQGTGDSRPFTVNLAGRNTGVSRPETPTSALQANILTPRTPTAERAITAIPAPPHPITVLSAERIPTATPQETMLPAAKNAAGTASATVGPMNPPMTAEGGNQNSADAATVGPSGGLNTGAASGMLGSYAPPSYAVGNDPIYPQRARMNGWEGEVWLRLGIAADGAVTRIIIERSSSHEELDLAAVSAVKRWRFHPASRNGIAVEETVLLPLTFRLQPAE